MAKEVKEIGFTAAQWVDGITQEVASCHGKSLDDVFRLLNIHLTGYMVIPSIANMVRFENDLAFPVMNWYPPEPTGFYVTVRKGEHEWFSEFHVDPWDAYIRKQFDKYKTEPLGKNGFIMDGLIS